MKERLYDALKKSTKIPVAQTLHGINENKQLIKALRREIVYFVDEGTKGKYLQQAYNFIKTIRPTSVDCERAFSFAGLLCTKIRSRINDGTLDALCFLRSHFNKKIDFCLYDFIGFMQ